MPEQKGLAVHMAPGLLQGQNRTSQKASIAEKVKISTAKTTTSEWCSPQNARCHCSNAPCGAESRNSQYGEPDRRSSESNLDECATRLQSLLRQCCCAIHTGSSAQCCHIFRSPKTICNSSPAWSGRRMSRRGEPNRR